MSDKVYDIAKWALIIFVPALILLITTLGSIYKFDTEVIIATITAVATFAGSLLGISNASYYKKKYEDLEKEN